MKWADLVLSYLQALAWPAVVIWALWEFRSQIGSLILSAKRVTAFGAEAEFEVTNLRLKQTELEIKETTVETPETTQRVRQKSAETISTVRTLLSFDANRLDSIDPLIAAKDMTSKLEVALRTSLRYFDVPWPTIGVMSAGVIMERLTGLSMWQEFISLFEDIKDDLESLKVRRGRSQGLSKEGLGPRDIAGQIYRMSAVLIDLLEKSIVLVAERANESEEAENLPAVPYVSLNAENDDSSKNTSIQP